MIRPWPPPPARVSAEDALTAEPHIHPLVRFAVHRRVTMGMLLVGTLVLGGLALERLPLEFLPTISSSNISVEAPYPSASPEEVERLIVRPLEDSFGTLNRLDRLAATSSANNARINLTFLDGTDMDLAAVEVRDRIDRVRHLLPADLRQLRVRRFQTSDIPVMSLHLAAEGPSWSGDRLYDFTEQVVQRRLERLGGVARIRIRGLKQRQVQVRLDRARLGAHGVDVRQLTSRLRQNHVNLSAGHVEEGSRKLLVRVLGEFDTLEQIRELPVDDRGLRLDDVAEVTYAYPRQESFHFLNGVESLTLSVYKVSTANLLEVVDRVRDELAAIAQEPASAGLGSRVYHDASIDVRQGLAQLRGAGLLGGALAVLAVFLFLRRIRTTLVVGLAIPISVVTTFVLMFLIRQAGWADLSLNVISLMGLVLALGMLVDSSIVVIESIYHRMEACGEDVETAALRGASEVALPILASTATTLCVFIPVIFLRTGGGFFSLYLKEIGFTVCIVLVASLLVALTVVPTAAVLLLRHETPRGGRLLAAVRRGYGRGLAFTLHHRAVFFVLVLAMLWGSWKLFGSIERTFASRSEPRQVVVNVDTPRSYTLEQTRALFEDTVALLQAQREALDIADIATSYRVGSGRSRGFDRARRIEVFLVDESEGRLTTTEARDRIRELFPVRAGVEFRIAQNRRRHGSSGLEVELVGEDPSVLEILGRGVAAKMAAIPGVRDVDLSLESGDDEVRVRVAQDKASQADLSSQAVAFTVQSALSDRALATLKTEEREVDLIMQFRDEDRETLGQLKNVPVQAGGGARPLDTLADFELTTGASAIERENRLAKVSLTTNTTSPAAMFMAMGGVRRLLEQTAMPSGYSWSFGRWNRMAEQDQQGAGFALLFALLLVYMLMAALFESFTHPLSIMVSVPFAFIGVGVVMKLAGQPRDNFTELGFLILIGVVVNNAIVLIDHVNRLRRDGASREAAIIHGGQHRLRAILMTAVTTILGLLPMVAPVLFPEVFGSLEGRAGTWAPVGLVILGGLTTSTFLTLMVVPTVYSVIDDVTQFVRRVVRAA